MEESLSKILQLALEQGIWAALYLYLFFRMLKENRQESEQEHFTKLQKSAMIK